MQRPLRPRLAPPHHRRQPRPLPLLHRRRRQPRPGDPNTRVLYVPVDAFLGDGLYVLAIDDAHLAKRVQRFADGALELLPYNAAYKPETLAPVRGADTPNTYRTASGNTAAVRFVGKVVYYTKAA